MHSTCDFLCIFNYRILNTTPSIHSCKYYRIHLHVFSNGVGGGSRGGVGRGCRQRREGVRRAPQSWWPTVPPTTSRANLNHRDMLSIKQRLFDMKIWLYSWFLGAYLSELIYFTNDPLNTAGNDKDRKLVFTSRMLFLVRKINKEIWF